MNLSNFSMKYITYSRGLVSSLWGQNFRKVSERGPFFNQMYILFINITENIDPYFKNIEFLIDVQILI